MLIALEVCLQKLRANGQRLLAVTHTVAFEVGFCHEVDAHLIAEVIPARVVGVVRRSYGVDVMLFQDVDVLNHAFNAHHVAAIGVEFVAVSTLDEDGLTIDKELSVLDFHLSESYALRRALQHVALLVEQRGLQGVEMGRFSCPFFGRFKAF